MPDPVYIICSASGSEDKATGLLSLFNIVEKVRVTQLEMGTAASLPSKSRTLPIRVTAVWMRRPEDTDEQVYDFQVAFLLPNDPKEHVVGEGQVSFGRNECFRVFADGDIHSFGESGVYRAICRVKPTGSDKWQSQSYPIIVDVVKVSAPTPLATTG